MIRNTQARLLIMGPASASTVVSKSFSLSGGSFAHATYLEWLGITKM